MRHSLVILIVALSLAGCATQPPMERHYAAPPEVAYRLDTGDELRIVVYDEATLTNTYTVDDGGRISMPLIGSVRARDRTVRELEQAITAGLAGDYLREPSVSVEVQTYRPFFILGEVGAPGQYPYVADLTAERAVAIAGGFSPRAVKSHVRITRRIDGEIVTARVPADYPVDPGDTIEVIERWF